MTDSIIEPPVLCAQEKSYAYGRSATVAQCLSTFVISLTYFGVGILVTIPTIVVGNLLNSKSDILSLNEEEASWFGSIPFLLQPIGALIGIFMQDYFSQRYSLWLSNLLGLAFFVTLYKASTTSTVLLSSVWMALCLGFTEPSGMGYISEYSEARLRGFLCSSTLVMMSVGLLFTYFIGAVTNWRTTVLICGVIPVLSLILLPWIPESPIWLLSKGRKKKTLNALVWLRGWVRSEDVEEEFEDLDNYVKTSLMHHKVTNPVRGKQAKLSELLSSVLERRTWYPLYLLTIFMLTTLVSSSIGARSYAINLFKELQISTSPERLTLTMGIAQLSGTIVVLLLLKYTGKRKLSILALFLSSFLSICLGTYIHYKDELQMSWIFTVLLFALCFESAQSGMIPWLLMGELFPVRSRHAGSGLAGALFDIMIFFLIKTYFLSNHLLGTELLFIVSGFVGFIGCFYLFLYLPETEGKSLAEIEKIFAS